MCCRKAKNIWTYVEMIVQCLTQIPSICGCVPTHHPLHTVLVCRRTPAYLETCFSAFLHAQLHTQRCLQLTKSKIQGKKQIKHKVHAHKNNFLGIVHGISLSIFLNFQNMLLQGAH